ncbi:MAG: hypothetical protein Kow00111_24100 [Thermincola ferriacetica]
MGSGNISDILQGKITIVENIREKYQKNSLVYATPKYVKMVKTYD